MIDMESLSKCMIYNSNSEIQRRVVSKLTTLFRENPKIKNKFPEFANFVEFPLLGSDIDHCTEQINNNRIFEGVKYFFEKFVEVKGKQASFKTIFEALDSCKWIELKEKIIDSNWKEIEGFLQNSVVDTPKKTSLSMTDIKRENSSTIDPDQKAEATARAVTLSHATYNDRGNTVKRQIMRNLSKALCANAEVIQKTKHFLEHENFGLYPADLFQLNKALKDGDHHECFSLLFEKWLSMKGKDAYVGVILDILEDLEWKEAKLNVIRVDWNAIPGIQFRE